MFCATQVFHALQGQDGLFLFFKMLRILAIACLSFASNVAAEEKLGAIIGGKEASIADFPYMVAIYGRMACGSTILTTKHLLTAAHCIEKRDENSPWNPYPYGDYILKAGTSDLTNGGVYLSIKSWVPHPSYDENTDDYDVGIIHLAEPITFNSKMKPISLPPPGSKVPPVGSPVKITGWGKTDEGNPMTSLTLNTATVHMVSHDECQKEYSSDLISDRMICASAEGKDSCQGDSGGPLLDNNRAIQVGIVSWARGCAQHSGIYTNLFNEEIRNFIKNQTGV